ncbi:MAG: DUF1501 domain-containing protein [Planctomycetes bacterium]|nr:DUF1501 domain-containing protein [Planctomycetota bacterium]
MPFNSPASPPVGLSRRSLLARSAFGLGLAALGSLAGGARAMAGESLPGLPGLPHFAARAKRVICLFMSGGPSHLDLFDPKPELDKRFDQDLPESVRGGQRITGMVAGQARLALQPSRYRFAQHGRSGQWLSELLPHLGGVADELCVIRSLHTEAINHDPAITMFQTGSQQPGRPSMGAWLDYGLGSLNADLPAFVVMNSVPSTGAPDQGLLTRLWGPGFLPSRHQGVQLRSGADPVLYLSDPPGIDRARRRDLLDGLGDLNRLAAAQQGDPEIQTRIAQYEMAFRMQASVPELVDLAHESDATFALYGEDARKPGTFARNCLLARRLAERGVRFIQLYHRGWDHHGGLAERLPVGARDTDQAAAGLIADLRQRGMLDDTLVIWAGEFGRTCYAQGGANREKYGRDHHGRAFSAWLAGGGIKPGVSWGATDDFGFNIASDPVHVHDLQATILHCLGIDHERLTYRSQGRQFRLTDVEGKVMKGMLA